MNAHVDLQIIGLPEDGTTALAPDARQQPATGRPLDAFFPAVKIGVGNRRLIRRLGGCGGGGTGVNAALVSFQLAHPLEALPAYGAGVHDAWRVALYLLSIFPFLRIVVVTKVFLYKREELAVIHFYLSLNSDFSIPCVKYDEGYKNVVVLSPVNGCRASIPFFSKCKVVYGNFVNG